MSYTIRCVFFVDVQADTLPSDLEAFAREAVEDGSADLALCGTVAAICNICDLSGEDCGCVADDDDAREVDYAQRARDARESRAAA